VNKKLLSTLSLCSICFSTAAFAQENNDYFITKLDTVTVVATKSAQSTFTVPGMVDVIDMVGDASTAGATTMSDVFINTPSVQMTGTSRRNGQIPTIRGLSPDSVLLLVDGVRQNFEAHHDGRIFVEPSLLKQVEVVRGPASSLYGSGAMGGVLAFDTVRAGDMLSSGETLGGDISVGFDSVNTSWTETVKSYGRYGDIDILGAVTKADSGNVSLSDGTDLHADDDLLSGVINADWFANEYSTVSFGYNGYYMKSEEPNNPQLGMTDPNGGTDFVDKIVQNHSTHAKYNYKNDDHAFLNNFSAQLYFNNTQVNETVLATTALNSTGDRLERQLNTLGFNLDNQTMFNNTGFGNHTLSYGVEYFNDNQHGRDTGETNGENGGVPDAGADTFGTYLQNEIAFTDLGELPGTLTVIPGVRYDSYSSDDELGNSQNENRLSPKVATSYRPNDWLMIFSSYAEAFRAPKLTELYSSGTHFPMGPFTFNNFIPNPDLKPEKSKTVEIGTGLEFKNVMEQNDKIRFKGSRYWTHADDFIDLDVNMGAMTSQYYNVEKAKLDGYDLELGYDAPRWAASVAYSVVSGNNQVTGDYLTSITPASVNTNVEVKFPESGVKAGWTGHFAEHHDKVNVATYERRGFGVHGVYVSWQPQQAENLTVNAGVDNIFDKKYETVFAGSAEEGRNFRVHLNWKF